ncbi:hypothetical protein [Nocardioides sp. 616]|uniref:hypothetical protein n=1 Tax=Nocardioides sp. 616 TaxID=2268090 RepID=UPI0013B3CB36|nr:hypothetical protein [Nocardioides sp. 616]
MNCKRGSAETQEHINSTVNQYRYRVRRLCTDAVTGVGTADEGTCDRPFYCDDPPSAGLYMVERQLLTGGPWTREGDVCLGNEAEIDVQGQAVSTAMVTTAFRNLTWPAARLNIQPVDGETLVNLDTIFYTDSTTPVTKNLTLLGQSVTIEATPAKFTWHWTTGDDPRPSSETPLVTDHGGAAYPDQTITHRYRDAGTTTHPRLDVTYTGRYRVGGSEWTAIPATRTIQGTPQPLSVLEARPTLVR